MTRWLANQWHRGQPQGQRVKIKKKIMVFGLMDEFSMTVKH